MDIMDKGFNPYFTDEYVATSNSFSTNLRYKQPVDVLVKNITHLTTAFFQQNLSLDTMAESRWLLWIIITIFLANPLVAVTLPGKFQW